MKSSIINPTVDKDYLIGVFRELLLISNKITTGNYVHQINELRWVAKFSQGKIKSQLGEIDIYNNLQTIIDITDKVFASNLEYNLNTIKGICKRSIAYLKEFGI